MNRMCWGGLGDKEATEVLSTDGVGEISRDDRKYSTAPERERVLTDKKKRGETPRRTPCLGHHCFVVRSYSDSVPIGHFRSTTKLLQE